MALKLYKLPDLPYGYGALAPVMSEELLRLHHTKHHAVYVAGANGILEKMDMAKAGGEGLDLKAELKALSFNIGGHVLHSLFWENLAPAESGGGELGDRLAKKIDEDFGTLEKLKEAMVKTAMTVEGSGWAALTYCKLTGRLIPMQIEKHNVNLYPLFNILLVIDAFEHAYYIDYKNEKAKFFEGVWKIINWKIVEDRYKQTAGA